MTTRWGFGACCDEVEEDHGNKVVVWVLPRFGYPGIQEDEIPYTDVWRRWLHAEYQLSIELYTCEAVSIDPYVWTITGYDSVTPTSDYVITQELTVFGELITDTITGSIMPSWTIAPWGDPIDYTHQSGGEIPGNLTSYWTFQPDVDDIDLVRSDTGWSPSGAYGQAGCIVGRETTSRTIENTDSVLLGGISEMKSELPFTFFDSPATGIEVYAVGVVSGVIQGTGSRYYADYPTPALDENDPRKGLIWDDTSMRYPEEDIVAGLYVEHIAESSGLLYSGQYNNFILESELYVIGEYQLRKYTWESDTAVDTVTATGTGFIRFTVESCLGESINTSDPTDAVFRWKVFQYSDGHWRNVMSGDIEDP